MLIDNLSSKKKKLRLKSLCGVYAYLIKCELEKRDPDLEKINKYLDIIIEHCRDVSTGETPKHLVPYLIKKGECKGLKGVVKYKGKVIPKVAKCVAEKRTKNKK